MRLPARTDVSLEDLLVGELPRLRRLLAAAVRRTCPPWLEGQIDDLIQASLLKVTERVTRGEGNPQLASSYIWRVAYSVVVDEIRRRRRQREVPLEDELRIREPAEREPGPEQQEHARRIGLGIMDCLKRIAPDRRRAVVLRLQGHPVREVASLMGWSPKRAENLVYRGLEDLRECLKGKGLEP